MRKAISLLAVTLLLGGWTHSVPGSSVPSPEVVTPNSNQAAPTNSVTKWRDQEVTTGWFARGEINLRTPFLGASGSGYTPGGGGLFFNVGVAGAGAIRAGIISGGQRYNTYVQNTPASCITNWPSSGSHNFTFGVKGFTVYFKIDGVVATDTCQTNPSLGNLFGNFQYYEYRPGCCDALSPAIWIQTGGNGTATFTYFPYQFLYSSVTGTSANGVATGTMTFDPRDFGMHAINNTGVGNPSVVTGSMSAGSPTLTLNTPADIRVGDHIIVEIGGESGFPTSSNPFSPTFPNITGVGGTAPVLNYATTTAMNADTSQANATQAWVQTDGRTWTWTSGSPGSWTENEACDYVNGNGDCYSAWREPVSLVAWVTAVNASPATTVTLNINSVAATTNANVYLDTAPSFYPYTVEPSGWFAPRDDGLLYVNHMTINVPAGDWYQVGGMAACTSCRDFVDIHGQGASVTTLHNAKGWPSGFFNLSSNTNTANLHDIGFAGNICDLCATSAGWSGANRNVTFNAGAANLGGGHHLTAQNINCLDVGECVDIGAGTVNPPDDGHTALVIRNVNVTITQPMRVYDEWQMQLNSCDAFSEIVNSSVTGPYLIKAYALFACSNAKIVHSAGQNALYDLNSSTNWTIDFNTEAGAFDGTTDTITANSFISEVNGSANEGVFQVNDNAFGSGNTGLINNARVIQQGWVDSSSYHSGLLCGGGCGGSQFGYNNSLVEILDASPQTHVTVQGQFPGTGCHTDLGGYFIAPNMDFTQAGLYGGALHFSAGFSTITGVRVVGNTTSGANGPRFGWTSSIDTMADANSSVTNSIADTISAGTQSGNQTNAAYGGC